MFLIVFLFSMVVTSNLYANIYTIQQNDSLWKIATKHKISLSDIRKLNDLYTDNVYANQKIYLPSSITNYLVKNGDSFQSIATKFNTKIKYIVTLNNLSENHVIEGQTLKIPLAKKRNSLSVTAPPKIIKTTPLVYRVKRGDTLSDVALEYKTTVPKLRLLNNKKSNSILIGEKLIVGNRVIPQTKKPSENKIIHKVKSGETLNQIAINYRVSSRNILEWNNKNSTRIYINEKLTLYVKKPSINNTSNYKKIKYTVRRGENLSYIAAKFGTSPSIIKKINNKKSDKLLVGETLTISVKVTKDLEHSSANRTNNTKLIRYKVRRGDTLDDIAIKHNVRRTQLLSWNNKNSTRIYIGESLKIYVAQKNMRVPTPKSSKKAEYIKSKKTTGIKSNKFKNIPLPVKANQILSTTTSGRGIDLILKSKENIVSPANATIQYAGYINALQNVVILQLSEERTIVYAGLDRLNVTTGQQIAKGYLLGSTGINQIDKKPKLYMEMRDNNKVVNALYTYKELSKKQK